MGNKIRISETGVFALGFAGAIFISSFYKFGITVSFLLFVLAITIFLYGRYLTIEEKEKKKIIFLALFLFSFGLGIFRYEIKDAKNLDENLESKIGTKSEFTVFVDEEPIKKETYKNLIVEIKEAHGEKVKGKALIRIDSEDKSYYGDILKIEGKLEKPENFESTTSKEFDYISYLSKDDIYYIMSFPKIYVISSGNGNKITTALYALKQKFIVNIEKTLPKDEADVMSAMLFGEKSSVSKSLTDTFRIAGITHIIVLSGYHISVVASALVNFFSFLPYHFALAFGFFGIILFVILTGASSTAIRAGIMAGIVILGKILNRKADIRRSLLIAGLFILFLNPKVLVFDLSFELSFLATFGIIYLVPLIKEKIKFIPIRFGIQETMAATISAQIMTLPLILYKMGMLSIVALPVNILVGFSVSLIMLFGFLIGAVSFIWFPLSFLLSWIAYILLKYFITVAEIFAKIPFSSVNISWFGKILFFVSYILIFYFVWKKESEKHDEFGYEKVQTKSEMGNIEKEKVELPF